MADSSAYVLKGYELELYPNSRSYSLREMYWNGEHEQYRLSRALAGSGDASLVGKARDFETLLDETTAVIQPLDLLAGVSLVVPAEGSSIDLGQYDGHYTPGHANIISMGLAGIRDRAAAKLTLARDPEKRDFLEATAISYEAARRFAARHADCAEQLAAETRDPARQNELARIAKACRQLAVGPPNSFHAGLR